MRLITRIAPVALAVAVTRALRRRNPYQFAGRSVLITGGSRGLGLIMARQLAAEGARLTLMARDRADLENARDELVGRGAAVEIVVGDVGDRADATEAVEQAVRRYGRIDVLINNAGIIQAGPMEHMQVEDFEQAMAVHLWGPLYTTLAALPHMRRQGGGRIVNISSIGGKVATPHLLPYSTSKFALVGLSDGLRAELAKDNIVVTTVCPGLLRTGSPINAIFKGQHQKEFAWFSISDSLPLLSFDADRAAAQILDACRHGSARLIISVPAQLLALQHDLLPELTARILALVNRFLPAPTDASGDAPRSGWESHSKLAPSILTRLSDNAAMRNNELMKDGAS